MTQEEAKAIGALIARIIARPPEYPAEDMMEALGGRALQGDVLSARALRFILTCIPAKDAALFSRTHFDAMKRVALLTMTDEDRRIADEAWEDTEKYMNKKAPPF